MISFFRRALSSWLVLGLLGLILVAFIITGVNAPTAMGGSSNGGLVAKAGSTRIGGVELADRVRAQFEASRREQPQLDMKAFLAAGAFEQVATNLIAARAVESWGLSQGFKISKRLVDAQIAGYPAFRGVTGQFDEATMRSVLAQARVSEKSMRDDAQSQLLRDQIVSPTQAPVPTPVAMGTPYARLLIDQRAGSVGIIPLAAVVDRRLPAEPEILAAYKANIAAYTQPEARSLRYALFGADQVAAAATPSEAEIAAYYKSNAATYAARDTRDLTQVIAPTEAAAQDIATAARSGGTLQAAAAKAGVEASHLSAQVRADYAKASNDAVATAVFAAAKGGVIAPVKGAFGWYVVKVEAIGGTPARSLDQARAEISEALAKQKRQDALSDLAEKIENAIADGSSFAEIARDNKLVVVETPPILSTGQAPDDAAWKGAPELAPLLRAGFQMSADDKPLVETVLADQKYALLGVSRIVPPTPLPIARVRDAVIRDIVTKRTMAKARAVAETVTAAVNKGVPMAKAMADTGLVLPPVQPARARFIDLQRAQGQAPSALRMLFTLKPRTAKSVPADNGTAIFVVQLESITPGDLAQAPGLVENARGELSRAIALELVDQFGKAAEKSVAVVRYPDAIAQVKRQMAGGQ